MFRLLLLLIWTHLLAIQLVNAESTWELYDEFNASNLAPERWDLAWWEGGNPPTISAGRASLSGDGTRQDTRVTATMLEANADAANLIGGDGHSHSILEFKDSATIEGVEMLLTLPADAPEHVGIGLYAIDYDAMFNGASHEPIRFSTDIWHSSNPQHEIQICWRDPITDIEQSLDLPITITPGEAVKLAYNRSEDRIRFYLNDQLLIEDDYSSKNETLIIRTVSETGANFDSFINQVRVLGPSSWVLYDQFNAGSLDTANKWSTWFSPGGVAPVISSGKLELEVDPNASASKNIVFESGEELDVSGFTEPNTGLSFAAAPIIGVEADLFLPAGVALESGVGVGSLSLSGDPVFAGIELANRPEGVKLEYEIGETNLGVTPAILNQTYRVRVINIYGRLRIYIDGNEVADAIQPEGFLGFTIFAFNDASQAMTATVDNVRVFVDPDLAAPAVLADSDNDGLSNYDETNLYLTDPNNDDKFGDGFKDGELVLAGADPNVDYAPVVNLIDGKLEDARAGSVMIDVTSGSAFLELQIERSEDLSSWSQNPEDKFTVEIPLTNPSDNGFFRFAFPE